VRVCGGVPGEQERARRAALGARLRLVGQVEHPPGRTVRAGGGLDGVQRQCADRGQGTVPGVEQVDVDTCLAAARGRPDDVDAVVAGAVRQIGRASCRERVWVVVVVVD